jgi:hypothetical protein
MNDDPELVALSTVCNALSSLDSETQQRVLEYAAKKFGLRIAGSRAEPQTGQPQKGREQHSQGQTDPPPADVDVTDDTNGISPVAIKWMQRNGFTIDQLGHLFSLGTDEIDLVAQSVPGGSKNLRTRSVAILKGIAAYLSTGVARVTAEQIKEACLHYDAYDSPNHAKYLRGMSTELTGNKSSGYTLTARGITAGTELIREILGTNG